MEDKVFDKFRARLIKEGWIKSLICGLIVGFAALLISCAIFWFIGFKAVWVGAIIAVAAFAITAPVFYFVIFRPTEKTLARRMDALGLEERIITMKELEGNDSFMAQRQRADAVSAISRVDAKLIKMSVSVGLSIALGVTAVLGIGMASVSTLAAVDVIESGNDIIENMSKGPVKTYTVTYEVTEGGYIEGDMVQLINEGEDADQVTAIAEEGYVFVGWVGEYHDVDDGWYEISDLKGVNYPTRQDVEISYDIIIVAEFRAVNEGDGDGDGDEPNDAPNDVPNDSNQDNGGPDGPPQFAPPSNNPGAGGDHDDSSNQVVDGDTFYGSEYDGAYEDAVGGDNGNNGGVIGDYFETIH